MMMIMIMIIIITIIIIIIINNLHSTSYKNENIDALLYPV